MYTLFRNNNLIDIDKGCGDTTKQKPGKKKKKI